ncbi:MAG: type II toxin-antitoxin system VapC family toxin [Candidatus Nanohaloarchaea archaeon]
MIYDTSSLVHLLFNGEVEELFDSGTLELAFYEASNVIWKKNSLQNRINNQEAEEALEALKIIEREMEIQKPDRKKAMKIAREEEIAFYDASFISVARDRGEKLVTEDHEMKKSAEDYVKTVSTSK